MATSRADIDAPTREFLERQSVFFVASAPLSGEDRVNVSPKSADVFRVHSPTRVSGLFRRAPSRPPRRGPRRPELRLRRAGHGARRAARHPPREAPRAERLVL